MKKATIVLFALFFGLFFLPGVSFACDHENGTGGHEMMQPEGPGGEGYVCPCHEADGGDKVVPETAPAPSKPDGVKPGKSAKEMHQHHPGFDPRSSDEGRVCPHHK
ncbi:MAG: hypothetical protein HZC03_02560 [Candidatus Lloydbacteria bacterium]|nr:hypothetical protein [Candidatus Lloydbacteria bacterium]